MVEILKVSSKSNPNSVAGALAGVVRGAGSVEVQVVGAGALNQAVKALAIARSYVANTGMDLACRPTFADIEIDGEERTAIRLLVETFAPHAPADQARPAAADVPTKAESPRADSSPAPGEPRALDGHADQTQGRSAAAASA